jgi:hypothetical protein
MMNTEVRHNEVRQTEVRHDEVRHTEVRHTEVRHTEGGNGGGSETAVQVHEVLRQVHGELRHLLQQRAELVRRICMVKKTIVGLATLLGDAALSDELQELVGGGKGLRKPGLTQACRTILMKAGQVVSAREVHDQIQEEYPAILAGHKDSMASVTTILSRLASQGEAQILSVGAGRRAWKWAAETDEQAIV